MGLGLLGWMDVSARETQQGAGAGWRVTDRFHIEGLTPVCCVGGQGPRWGSCPEEDPGELSAL